MGVKSKVSVSDLLNAQEKWHNGGKMKGGYDCVSSGALICDAGPDYFSNLRALPFLEEYGEERSPSSEIVYGCDTTLDPESYHYMQSRKRLAARTLTRHEAHEKGTKIKKARRARARAAKKARAQALVLIPV